MRPLHKLRFNVARNLGDFDEYHEAYETWLKSPKGDLSDCSACDLDAEVEYLADNGREAEAMEHARPILNGASRCRTVPHRTLSKLLLPLIRLGRVAEAMPLHHKGYRLIANNRAFLYRLAEHIEFLVLTENLNKAVKVFANEFRWALETTELDGRFHYANTSRFLFERLQASGKSSIKLRLPEEFPAFEASGLYSVPAMIAWFEGDAAEIARKFDARNGNDVFARTIEKSRKLEALIAPFPLRGPAKGKVE
jgi:tetratricopeptide (TPR) repeat protein